MTMSGSHVFMKDGVATKGPAELVGKSSSDFPEQHQLSHRVGSSEAGFNAREAAGKLSPESPEHHYQKAEEYNERASDARAEGDFEGNHKYKTMARQHGDIARSLESGVKSSEKQDALDAAIATAHSDPHMVDSGLSMSGGSNQEKLRRLGLLDANHFDKLVNSGRAEGSHNEHFRSLADAHSELETQKKNFNGQLPAGIKKRLSDRLDTNRDRMEVAAKLLEKNGDAVGASFYRKHGTGIREAIRGEINNTTMTTKNTVAMSSDGTHSYSPTHIEVPKEVADSPRVALCFANDPAEYREALTIGHDWKHPKTRNGLPCFYYWKESLPVGDFKDIDGVVHHVPAERVSRIISTYKLAASRGHEPFLPDAHTKRERKTNFGYIADVKRGANGSVEILHQFLGEAAKNEAMKNKSSIMILPTFEDEKGNVYEDLIDHNAILPNPRIANLGDFQPALAASSDQAYKAVLLTPVAGTSHNGEIPMTTDEVDKVRRMVADADPDAAQGMSADNCMDRLGTHLARIHKAIGISKANMAASREFTGLEKLEADEALPTVLKMGRDAATRATTAEAKLKDAATSLETANQKVMAFAREHPAPAKPSKSELHFASRAISAAKMSAIAEGRCSPACADEIEKRCLGKPIELKALTMSREVEDGDESLRDGLAEALKIYDILGANTPGLPPLGGMRFSSREIPGAGNTINKEVEKKWEEEEKAAAEQRRITKAS